MSPFGSAQVCLALSALLGPSAAAAPAISGWTPETRGDSWRIALESRPTRRGLPTALTLSLPGRRESRPGDFAACTRTLALPAGERARFCFTWGDDFHGPTAGYHFAQVLVDGAVAWESDVAGGDGMEQSVTLPLPERTPGQETLSFGLRVFEKKGVTNFPVRIWWREVRIEAAGRPPVDLLPPLQVRPSEPIPPDLPLPIASPSPSTWLRQACVLQPWGATQYLALTNVGDRPRRLRDEFGFNALILLPPAAHNAITAPAHHLTEAQFREGVAAYRAAGYRLILYSSVMHCGHAPEWQTGQLGRDHPEWAQRDAGGGTVTIYGAPWLCPNTPALGYTLNYTERLLREYQADGVMLDNNQFFQGENGWTCHCDACQARFREYVLRRFGAAGREALQAASDTQHATRNTQEPSSGTPKSEIRIPKSEIATPLRSLWLHWRNRVWAETNEAFRARLRRTEPEALLFANTQYEYRNGVLAVDLQYEHEDVVLSESRSLTSRRMSEKMLLGQAFAAGRPLWNYIGTFEEKNFSRLRAPEEVGPIVAASMAHGARPWIVYYGFQDAQGDYDARREMAALVSFQAAHPDLFPQTRWAPVGVVVSPRSRDLRGQALIPPHLSRLLAAGVPAAAIREEHLSTSALKGFRVLTLETAACMEDAEAAAIASWVRAGGTLIAGVDAGWFDALGRPRPRSALLRALGLDAAPERLTPVGRGRVLMPDARDFAGAAVEHTRTEAFVMLPARAAEPSAADGAQNPPDEARGGSTPKSMEGAGVPSPGIEVVPYKADGRLLLHLIRHAPASGAVVLRLPSAIRPARMHAQMLAPGQSGPVEIPLARHAQGIFLALPEAPLYGVIVLTVLR